MSISVFLSKFLSFFSDTFISPEVSSSKPSENKIFYCHQSSIHLYLDWGFMSTGTFFHESLGTTIHLWTIPPNPKLKPAKIITNVLLRESLCWFYINIFPEYWDLNKCALGCKLLEGMKHIHIFPQNSTIAGTTGKRWYSFTTEGLYACTN